MTRYKTFLRFIIPCLILALSLLFWKEVVTHYEKDRSDMHTFSYGLKGDGTLRGDEGYAQRMNSYWTEILVIYFAPLLLSLVPYLLFLRYRNLFWTVINSVTMICGIGLLIFYFVKVW